MVPKLSKARLLIFDFDGILIKKVPDEFPASLLDGFVKDEKSLPRDSVIRFQGTNWIDELGKMGIDTDDARTLEAISKRRHEYDKSRLVLYGWVPRVIPELAKTKKLAVLTNNSIAAVMCCLNGLKGHFSAIKTWENVPKLKPAPDGILCICRELGIAPVETLMIGDGEEDLVAAEKSGVKSLIIQNGEHLDGFVGKLSAR